VENGGVQNTLTLNNEESGLEGNAGIDCNKVTWEKSVQLKAGMVIANVMVEFC